MIRFPAVIIHGLDDACAALAHNRPVLLLSAAGAGCFAGVRWWLAVVRAARAAYPDTPCQDALDCAPHPGRALEALLGGQKTIIFPEQSPAFAQISGIAEELASRILPHRPPALDMQNRNIARELPQWLTTRSPPGGGST